MTRHVPAREAQAILHRLIDETNESHRPIVISSKRSSAVLVGTEDWLAIQETLFLLSVPGMRESVKKGMTEPIKNCPRAIRWTKEEHDLPR